MILRCKCKYNSIYGHKKSTAMQICMWTHHCSTPLGADLLYQFSLKLGIECQSADRNSCVLESKGWFSWCWFLWSTLACSKYSWASGISNSIHICWKLWKIYEKFYFCVWVKYGTVFHKTHSCSEALGGGIVEKILPVSKYEMYQ